jgi:hypothetical protein
LNAGHHEIGLHLEDSRSFAAFVKEKQILERHLGRRILAMSKHGSGTEKYGLRHYAAYEPEKYIEWARRLSMRLFLGNDQDPSIRPLRNGDGPVVFPSAFWLEPNWRDTRRFSVEWLLDHGRHMDIQLLVHPENILLQSELAKDFRKLVTTLGSRII